MNPSEVVRQAKNVMAEMQKAHRQGKPIGEYVIKLQALKARQIVSPGEAQRLQEEYILSEFIPPLLAAPGLQKWLSQTTNERTHYFIALSLWSALNLSRPDVVALSMSRDFVENLLATDFNKTVVTDLRMPFLAPFVLRMPPGYYILDEHGASWKPLEVIALTPFEELNPPLRVQTLHVLLQSGANKNEDPSIGEYSAVLLAPFIWEDYGSTTLLTLGEVASKAQLNVYKKGQGAFLDENGVLHPFPIEDYLHVVYGTLIYLNLHNPSLARISDRKPISSLIELVPSPARNIAVLKKGLDLTKRWPTAVITESVDKLPRTAYRHLVRGHFRNLRVGPGRTERSLRWIKPYIRHKHGPEGDPGTYTIEGLNDSDSEGFYLE